MDFLAGQDAAVLILFRQRGQPVIPTVASYSLYDTDGSVLLADQAISLGPTDTQATIVVDDSLNAIATDFEKRTLVIKYTWQSRVYFDRVSYRLINFLNHTITPVDVRGYLGVNDSELSDDQIDLVAAYFQIQAKISETLLEAALAAGDQKEFQANKAILYQAALNIIPSLQLRVAQNEKDGTIGFARPVIKDFSALRTDTEALLASALDIASDRTPGAYTFAVLGERDDVITGA